MRAHNGAASHGEHERKRHEKLLHLVSVCKNHDCYDNSMVLLYAAPSQTVYGKVFQRGRSTLVGAPPPPVAADSSACGRPRSAAGGEALGV